MYKHVWKTTPMHSYPQDKGYGICRITNANVIKIL